MRWNDGFTQAETSPGEVRLLSKSNLPGTTPDPPLEGFVPPQNAFLERWLVRRAQARFSRLQHVTYELANIKSKHEPRRFHGHPFFGGPFIQYATGGDILDSNAVGGGIPNNTTSVIGRAVPSRHSIYSYRTSRMLTHPRNAPVK